MQRYTEYCFTKDSSMRNFTALMIAGMIMVPGAMSANRLKQMSDGVLSSMRIDKKQAVNSRALNLAANKQHKAAKADVQAKVGEYGDIIYTAPEGKIENMSRSGYSVYPYNGYLYASEYEGKVSEVVTCDNGDVYMKNPIAMLSADSYLKGHKEGNTIVFNLPQAVKYLQYSGGDYEMVVTLLQYNEEEGWYYPANTPDAIELGLPEIENKLVLNIGEDGYYSYEGDYIDGLYTALGVMYGDDLSWAGYTDEWSTWGVMTDQPIEVPAGLSTKEVVVKHNGVGNFANIGFEGDNVYIQGIFEEMPEAWVKGERDGDKVTFASGQYLGIDFQYGNFIYFAAANIEAVYDEYYEEWADQLTYLDSITFNYDEESLTLTCAADEGIVYNGAKDSLYCISYYTSPVIAPQPAEISYTPQNPTALKYFDYYENYGYCWLDFDLSALNADGELLRKSNLYYKIYVDGDEYEFDTYDYILLPENMTLVPFNFSEGYDFIISGNTREVYFYFEGAEEIGVQLFYFDGLVVDGEAGELLGQSEIVSISTDSSGVKKVEAAKDIDNVRFYNLNGQSISNPDNGIFVKKVTYSDGTVKSFKVVRR